MTTLTPQFLQSLRTACQQLNESEVTIAISGVVITFEFGCKDHIHAHVLQYESEPTRNQLLALIAEQRKQPSLPILPV